MHMSLEDYISSSKKEKKDYMLNLTPFFNLQRTHPSFAGLFCFWSFSGLLGRWICQSYIYVAPYIGIKLGEETNIKLLTMQIIHICTVFWNHI